MTRVLVPVAVLEGRTVPQGLIDLLGTMDVTVLGYHVVPEQTAPDQAREQYGARAADVLEDITAEFRAAGGDADYRLVFTHDRHKTRRRIASETDARVLALVGATGPVERVLVPLTGEVATDRILTFVEELIGRREISVTMLLADDDSAEARTRLEAAVDRLTDAEITARSELAVDGSPFDALVAAAAEHDVVVIGERAPSLRSLVFGDEAERTAAETVGSVLVVRRNGATER